MISADVLLRILTFIVFLGALYSLFRAVLIYPRELRVERGLYGMIMGIYVLHALIYYAVVILYRSGIQLLNYEHLIEWSNGLALHLGISIIIKEVLHIKRYTIARREHDNRSSDS